MTSMLALCGWCFEHVDWTLDSVKEQHGHGICIGNIEPGRKTTTITIVWDRDLPDTEIERLSLAWAHKIDAKPVVAQTRVADKPL